MFPAHWWTVPSPGAAGCITHCVLQLVMDHYWADKPLVWDLEHVAFFCMSFKNRVSVSDSPPALLYTRSAGLQIQMLWLFVLLVQYPWTGEPNEGLSSLHSWGEPLSLQTFSLLWMSNSGGGVGLEYTASLSLLPISWFLIYIFCCGKYYVSLQVILINNCSVNS